MDAPRNRLYCSSHNAQTFDAKTQINKQIFFTACARFINAKTAERKRRRDTSNLKKETATGIAKQHGLFRVYGSET